MNNEKIMLDYIASQPQPLIITDSEFAQILKVSYSTIRRWRKTLVSNGLIQIVCRWSNCKKRLEYSIIG